MAELIGNDLQEVFIEEASFVFIAQPVIAYILERPCGDVVVEGKHQGLQGGYPSPYGGIHVLDFGRGGQAVFVRFASIAQYIFRNIAQVKVEVTSRFKGIFREGVHQPKFDVLNVGGFKIGGVYLAHDTGPAGAGEIQAAIFGDTSRYTGGQHIVIVGSAVVGEVSQVKHRQVHRLTVGRVGIGKYFGFTNQPHGVAREFILTHVGWPQVAVAIVKQRVNGVPGKAGTVESICQPCSLGSFRKHIKRGLSLRGAGHKPGTYIFKVYGRFAAFEVINITGTGAAHCPGVARDEMGKFTAELYARYGFGAVERQLVNHTRQPHAFGLIVEIQPPHGVGDGLLPEVGLLRKWPLMQIDEGGTHDKIIVHLIVHMHTHHGLGLQVEGSVVFERNIYGGTRI
ncbi:hypothetical protein DSECCO2_589590 [anaerobic digester metagenome]